MRASVIIPTRNRAESLRRCLDSLRRQTLPSSEFEVLVIDNGSSDSTPEVVRQYADQLPLSHVLAQEPGLHVARHAGMRYAHSDILMFADDDIVADPTWVEAVVETFRDPQVALVGGNNFPQFEVEPPLWLMHWWNQPTYRGSALGSLSILDFGEGTFDIDPGYVWGCNFSIRREVLLQAGGFHPDAMPPERLRYRGDGETHVSDVVRQTGRAARFNSLASVHHFVPAQRMTKDYFQHRAYIQGVSDSYTDIRRHGGLQAPVTHTLRRELGMLARRLKTGIRGALPLRGAHMREMLAVQMAALRAYGDGYAFHQRETHASPELLAWVLKSDYLV